MIAIAHGACTRPPNGERMHTRQSPISSRKRSTTIVLSVGTRAGRVGLLAEEDEQVARRALVEQELLAQPLVSGDVAERREFA